MDAFSRTFDKFGHSIDNNTESRIHLCTGHVKELFRIPRNTCLGDFMITLSRVAVKGARQIYLYHQENPPKIKWGRDGACRSLFWIWTSDFLLGKLMGKHPIGETRRYYVKLELL